MTLLDVLFPSTSSLINVFSNMFGDPNKVRNDAFIDSIVQSTVQLGFYGFTHEDVVHLMPANWGNDQQGALNTFNGYIQLGMSKVPGTNLSPYLSFGGGYVPGHNITWNGQSSTVNQTAFTNVSQKKSTTPTTSNTTLYIIIGAVLLLLFFIFIYAK